MAMNPHTLGYSAIFADTADAPHAAMPLASAGQSGAGGFSVACVTGAAALDMLAALDAGWQAGTPFQTQFWLRHWYAAFSGEGCEPLLVSVRVDGRPDPVMLLPLVRSVSGGKATIGFADAGVTDYNAPLLRRDARLEDASGLIDAILRALPPADLLVLDKMPALLDGVANPLAADRRARAARLYGNLVTIGDRFDDYIEKFDRKFRKEVGRIKRVFESYGDAQFVAAATAAEAMPLMQALEDIQRQRMGELDYAYDLDRPDKRDFYRAMVRDGIADGLVSLTALTVKGEVIAALLCINRNGHCAMVRLAQGGEAWSPCSPGRLLLMETMRHLHAQGFRIFDFTIGAYEYKRRLNAEHLPLVNVTAALSMRGQASVATVRLTEWLRQAAWLRAAVTRLRRMRAQS